MWGLTAVFLVFFALNPIESWLGVHQGPPGKYRPRNRRLFV